MKPTFLFIIFVLFILPAPSTAQTSGGNSLVGILPVSSFNDEYYIGVGLHGNVEFPLKDHLLGNIEAGVQRWSYQEWIGGVSPDEDMTFSLGMGSKILEEPFFFGMDAVYFFGDFYAFTVVPNTGFRLGRFNIEASYSILDPVQFFSIELGYFWADQ